MKNLIIQIFDGKDDRPRTEITLPIATFNVSVRFLPEKIKAFFENTGIDIHQSHELIKEKDLKGTLIEIQEPSEKVIISVE